MDNYNKKKRTKNICGGDPTDIGVLLKMVLDKHKISEDITFKTLCDCFENIVGTQLLPHVQPVEMKKNILVLKAANSAWKQELFLQKKAIIDKCNLVLGKPAVRDVRLI
ncbi:MAG: DUF721 domain-containing protein [Fibrobacter sp.]|nr:DUF721 domain-containing protein [Fibrobacter sp.]